MKKFTSALVLGLIAWQTLSAQTAPTGICGNSVADQQADEHRLLDNLNHPVATDRSGVVQYVPIHFHLVANAQGIGRIKENRVLDQLCELNEAYASQDIQFYLNPHPQHGMFDKSINNDAVYETQSNTFVMNNRRHPNALNVFVTNIADSGNPNPIGIVLAYYSPTSDWVVSRKDQVNGTGNGTLPHEIGHFFSLRHTFYGYESDPFDAGDAGWPVAPAISPGGTPTERQNGTNCTTAADLICDTPPDYNFGILAASCANYNGGAKDPLGTLVDPMENNFMGYFSNCDYEFTQGQKAVINTDLNSSQRNFLDNTFEPVATEIITPDNLLISPVGGDTVDFYNEVTFEWQATGGATHYLFEIDVTSSYSSPNAQLFLSTGTSQVLNNLQPNRTYYWRVRPFNQYYTCNLPKQRSFVTPLTSGTDNIAGLAGWSVSPNPLASGENAHVLLKADNDFEANLSVFDATGRQIYRNVQSFPAGNSNLELPLGELANGLYYVTLENAAGRAVRKLVVLR